MIMWPAVKAMVHSVYDQRDAASVQAQFVRLIESVDEKLSDVAEHLAGAVLAEQADECTEGRRSHGLDVLAAAASPSSPPPTPGSESKPCPP